MEVRHQYCLNVDIISLVLTWELEIVEDVEIIKRVMNSLFDETFCVEWIQSLNESCPRVGFDVSEGIEDLEEAKES